MLRNKVLFACLLFVYTLFNRLASLLLKINRLEALAEAVSIQIGYLLVRSAKKRKTWSLNYEYAEIIV